jgi:hypothetical protein
MIARHGTASCGKDQVRDLSLSDRRSMHKVSFFQTRDLVGPLDHSTNTIAHVLSPATLLAVEETCVRSTSTLVGLLSN